MIAKLTVAMAKKVAGRPVCCVKANQVSTEM